MLQIYYCPGVRAEKEITRDRLVRYIEEIFGDKMPANELKRLLPNSMGDEDQDEMVEA